MKSYAHSRSENENLELIGSKPDVERITAELDTAINDSGTYLSQYQFDYNTRFCLWSGQSRDGRKWDGSLGGAGRARPWEGASDVRTFTADEIVVEQKELAMLAWHRAQIQATALQSTQIDTANKIGTLMHFLLREQNGAETTRELELAIDWRQTYGVSALGVWWHQERRVRKERRTLEELTQMAQQVYQSTGSTQALEQVDKMLDPLLEEYAVELMIEKSPVLDRRGARKLLRELRTNGVCDVPVVYVATNQPCWEAMRVFVDVFFPIETSSFHKDCRWLARRRWLTRTDLAAMIDSDGWDEDWCLEVWKSRGQSYNLTENMRELAPRLERSSLTGVAGQGNAEHYVEVYDMYQRGIDEETGYPTIYKTVFSPLVRESYAKHEVLTYNHGKLPAIEMVRERVERQMLESRSVPEIAATGQDTIKGHRDAANDAAQMSTLPTLMVPMWRAMTPVPMGPAAQIPERTQGELRFLQPMQNTAAERQEDRQMKALAYYFGRPHPDVPPERQQRAAAWLVTSILGEAREAISMTFELCQQYMDDVEVTRIVGALQVPFSVSRDEIQGRYNVQIKIDPNELNFEMAMKKLEAIQKFALPMDTQGSIDRAMLVAAGMRMIDPHLAEAVVRTPQVASQGEIEDEKKNLVSILSGVEPPMREEGQNYALRLQVLTQELQANPLLAAVIQARPDVQAMLNARLEHLQFMAQQFGINAQTGRVGAEPGLKQLEMAESGNRIPERSLL